MSQTFRVFHRVPGPTTKPDEMFIPQYLEGGQWRAFTREGKPITFGSEVAAQQHLITFVGDSIDKITTRINSLYGERENLQENLKQLMKDSIGINARNLTSE